MNSVNEKDILDMKCWVFRIVQKRWNKSSVDCANLFKKYDIYGIIDKGYEYMHLLSYDNVVSEIEDILKNRGEIING